MIDQSWRPRSERPRFAQDRLSAVSSALHIRTVRTRWILASSKTHFDRREAKPVSVSGVFRDVTSRKNSRARGRKQPSQRLSTIQDEERQQIAEELHDPTTQHLVAVGL